MKHELSVRHLGEAAQGRQREGRFAAAALRPLWSSGTVAVGGGRRFVVSRGER